MRDFDRSTIDAYDTAIYNLFMIDAFGSAEEIMENIVPHPNAKCEMVVTSSDEFVLIHYADRTDGKLYLVSDVKLRLGEVANIERIMRYEANCYWVSSRNTLEVTMDNLFYRHVEPVVSGNVDVLKRLLVKPTASKNK